MHTHPHIICIYIYKMNIHPQIIFICSKFYKFLKKSVVKSFTFKHVCLIITNYHLGTVQTAKPYTT